MATTRISSTYITNDADWRDNLNPLLSELTGTVEVYAPDGRFWCVPKAAGFDSTDYTQNPFNSDTNADKGLTHDIIQPMAL